MELTVPVELVRNFRVLLLMHLMVMNFRLIIMVEKKVILLKNSISLLMVMLFLAVIIYLGAVIKSVTTGYSLLRVLLPFTLAILGP